MARGKTTILMLAASEILNVAFATTNAVQETSGASSCVDCHQGIESMHTDGDGNIGLSCVACHGGDSTAPTKEGAHVAPKTQVFVSSANPTDNFTTLNDESLEFIQFMNPGDFRVADKTCATCHPQVFNKMLTSIMAHSAMVPQAGLYNNGIHPAKLPVFGEAYTADGSPAIIASPPATKIKLGTSQALKLEPLPAFGMIPATDAFRVLERGNNDAGDRGPGTDFHVAGGGIVLNKTRLNDPTLWFLGGNQAPGDYRNSGCTACHVLYGNDRNPRNAGPVLAAFYASGGRSGYSASRDQNIPKDEPGHPVAHRMTVSVPVSQCLTCHHHQGNGALGSFVGAMWWDQETDSDLILDAGTRRDEQTSVAKLVELYANNDRYRGIQLEDGHGHSWNFRKVYHRDRKGNLLDAGGNTVRDDDPDKFKKAVHLQDIHFERGMHCIDCHTEQDAHGDGRLWGAMIDAVEIRCEDCHGTATERPTLITSGVAGGDTKLADRRHGARTPFGQRQFDVQRNGKIIQRSKIFEDLRWEVPQLVDAVNPSHERYNARAAQAKLLLEDGTLCEPGSNCGRLAHSNQKMECYTCHSSWNTNCYGCHLSADVNRKADGLHYSGSTTRGYVQYNPMVLRADAFQLGINGTSKGNKFSPMRSASAVIASVRDRARNEVVHQQPTISAAGYTGFAITPNAPHTVRAKETRTCSDCHVSEENDNNAWLASVLGVGTNAANFVGEYVYVAVGHQGVQAVKVTEGVEPQPVIGSHFHSILEPKSFAKFVDGGRRLDTAHGADSKDARGVVARGEFVFVAAGAGGLEVFDRANIANKAKAQRLVRNQNSRFGQRTSVSSRDATSVAIPSTNTMDRTRQQLDINLERPVAALFDYAYVTDREEGLLIVDVSTLTDHDPTNNFIGDEVIKYNPNGSLSGAVKARVAGNYVYLLSETTGLHIIDISKPSSPRRVAAVGAPHLTSPKGLDVQLRYLFVADAEGLKVIDISDPNAPTPLARATVPLADARGVYAVRTYAYVAAGKDGVAIIDIEKPQRPRLVEMFSAAGEINDANDLTTGTVNASMFAFIADGANGLRVVRLIGPPDTPGHFGFSPRPVPELIATFRTSGPALAISEGLKRDRSNDEDGNQISVGGRLGSHPLDKDGIDALLRRNGKIFTVKD